MTNLSFLSGTAAVTYEQIVRCYETDASRFVQIVADPDFAKVVGGFTRDEPPASTNIEPQGKPPESVRENRSLDANQYSGWLWNAIAAAQVAVCCELFKGSSNRLDRVTEGELRAFAKDGVQRFLQSNPDGLGLLAKKFELTDGIRTMIMLRCMGLFRLTSDHARQLSLGASSGVRELDALHARFWLQTEPTTSSDIPATKDNRVTFSSRYGRPEHVILVDGGDDCREFYQKLNTQGGGSRFGNDIVALNMLLDSALNAISKDIERGVIKGRNLIVAFRMEPRMLPDVEHFFSMLADVMDDSADFIVTVGAGNDASEFRHRVDKMNELTTFLENRALEPWRVRMYSGDLSGEQRCRPLFGIPELMSYEILYCKLKKENIK